MVTRIGVQLGHRAEPARIGEHRRAPCKGESGGWIVVDLIGTARGASPSEGKEVAYGERKLDSPVPVSRVVGPGVGLVVGQGM